MRISFENDYSEGCLPEILENLNKANLEQNSGYGTDHYSKSAKNKIARLLNVNLDQIDIHFAVGGTQSNLMIISHVLHGFANVLSASSGHIASNEAAAIEGTGHKVITIDTDPYTGKLTSLELNDYLENYWANSEPEHSALPGMIYFSNATEFGTHYTAAELESIREVADKYELPIFMDGARLGTAIMAAPEQLQFDQLVDLVDVFTIGATKNGALCGEAIIFTNRKQKLSDKFRWTLKKRGGMLAKGHLLGIQFDTLFTDDLFFRAAKHANQMADLFRAGFSKRKVVFWTETKTNQVFILLDPRLKQGLEQKFSFLPWLKPTKEQVSGFGIENSKRSYEVVRLVTSWASQPEQIKKFFIEWDLLNS